ncbi:hypothetical protein F442_14739 [Phytophthora nicotianae P10297]|uniref:Uncharacterized protein n=1 Tax=Phytophthora nicotianae P10297 TaxID=1317064 RepID=W2YQZ2_PHYNI|nr:hypothetical protein F442_14739 [Phytophthora nicotianae P10297]
MPTASKKLLRTIDPRERPCITTPQNSARSTPARTTPARTTPARTTPARTTPARTTPARTTPARATAARTTPAQTTAARTTAASTTPARTTSSNPTPAAAETPSQEPRGIFTTPNRQIQAQLHSAPPARVLFTEQQDVGADVARSLEEREASSTMPQDPAVIGSAPLDPRSFSSTQFLESEVVDTLASEFDIIAVSEQQMEEYLEQFDWEEVGEYGDEDTVALWNTILNPPSNRTSVTSNQNDSEASTDSHTSASDGVSNTGAVPQESSTQANNTNTNANTGSHFTTKTVGVVWRTNSSGKQATLPL